MPDITTEHDLRIAQLLDEALAEWRSGQTLDVAKWQTRHPDLANDLPFLLETLRDLDTAAEDWRGAAAVAETVVLGSSDDATEEPFDFLAPPEGPGELGRLGGYRVLRLLGAGGMGIVSKPKMCISSGSSRLRP